MECFRPLSGSFFLSENNFNKYIGYYRFRPLSGSFFLSSHGLQHYLPREGFRPLSGSFFLSRLTLNYQAMRIGFRPLSGSFFLSKMIGYISIGEYLQVSVPYRGLSFYLQSHNMDIEFCNLFPSPIGVFLFILRKELSNER